MKNKEPATIRPSEHLELIIYRIDRLVTAEKVNHAYWDEPVLNELKRLQAYLIERGE